MTKVTIERDVKVNIEQAWSVWNDYGNIALFNPVLKASHLVDSQAEVGLGCERVCEMKDGKNWLKEVITEYEPLKKISIEVTDGTMPLKKAVATIRLFKINAAMTEVRMEMNFEPGMGVLGKLMTPLMKMQFTKMLGQMMDAYVNHTENLYKKAA